MKIKKSAKYIGTNDKNNQLLFLHGYLASSKTFAYQLDYFSRDFEVFAPDLKGFGENTKMDYPFSLDDYILDVKEYMYKNGIKNPSVIAHSFGGRIAIKLSATEPLTFNKLVLTGCAGLKPKTTLTKFIKNKTYKLLKNFIPKEKLSCFYSKDYNQLNQTMKESFKKIVNEHLDNYLISVKNQTLLIFGFQDKETPVYMAKKLNKNIENSKLLIFEGAGHFCFIDKPLKFNMEVKEFLLS